MNRVTCSQISVAFRGKILSYLWPVYFRKVRLSLMESRKLATHAFRTVKYKHIYFLSDAISGGEFVYLKFPRFLLFINPLNAELNPICHLLILLGDLTFMGTYIVSIFQYVSNKMQRYTVYLYLKTALHVSSGTSTHHQERIQLYLQHLVFVTPLLLPAAIVEELELV